MECKFARDFQTADRIQEELLSHGVDVHDGFKEWRADGEGWSSSFRDRAPRGPKVYYQRGPGIGLSEAEIEEINAFVAERSECKANADYDRADAIFDIRFKRPELYQLSYRRAAPRFSPKGDRCAA